MSAAEPEVINAEPVSEPGQLLALAIRQNVDVEKLERLMELQERWNKQQAEQAFFEALAEFQATVPRLPRSKTVHFQTEKGSVEYHYAPLGDIDEIIRPLLLASRLSKRWEIADSGGLITVTCIITHANGHSERTTMAGAPDTSGAKNPIQQRGSTVAYLQRYTLIGALGLTTADEDIDARMGNGKKGEPITESQAADLAALIDEVKADQTKFLSYMKAASIAEIPAMDYSRAIQALNVKRRQPKGEK